MTTAASNSLSVRFDGNRALVSNQQSHDADPNTFLVYSDLYNDIAGRRRKRPGLGQPIQNTAAGVVVGAMHEFVYRSPTTGAITYYVLRAVGTTIEMWDTGLSQWVTSQLPSAFSGSSWVFLNFRNRCYACSGGDAFIYFDSSTGPDGRRWYTVGAETPAIAAAYNITVVDVPYIVGTVNVLKGSLNVVGVGTTWVTSGAWSDKWIDIAGVRYQISVVNTTTTLTLKDAYKGSNAIGLAYRIYTGLMEWEEPPKYTYAYKNSRTGHVGPAAPFTEITEKDRFGTTPRLTAIPYSASAFNNGYDKIQVFRSAKSANIAVAINDASALLNNANAVGTTTFTENASTFRDLNLGELEAPGVSNARPEDVNHNPLIFSTIAEWNGRLFALSVRDGLLYYSSNNAEIAFGRSDECFPPINQLEVSNARGLVTIGVGNEDDTLVVQTGFGDRAVVGIDALTFRTRRLPTHAAGGFQYGGITVANRLVQLYADKKLFDYGRDDGNEEIGLAIQDVLNGISDAHMGKTRIHWFSSGQFNLLLVSTTRALASTENDVTWAYDYTNACWYRWNFGISAFATTHNPVLDSLELWGANAADRKVYKLLQPNVFTDGPANTTYAPELLTAIMRPAGEDAWSKLAWYRAFVSNAGLTWPVTIYTNEDTVGETYNLFVDNFRHQAAQGREIVWQPTSRTIQRGAAFQFRMVWPTTTGDLVVEKMMAEFTPDVVAAVR